MIQTQSTYRVSFRDWWYGVPPCFFGQPSVQNPTVIIMAMRKRRVTSPLLLSESRETSASSVQINEWRLLALSWVLTILGRYGLTVSLSLVQRV